MRPTVPTRIAARLARASLNGATRVECLGNIDLEAVVTGCTEQILNLPGALPFFPTNVTDLNRVKELIERLHPVANSHSLVRLGPNADGGYLVPDDLEAIKACFSPGVSDRCGFEMDCAEMGMDVFMADASIEKPPQSHPKFNFIKKFIGCVSQGDFVTLSDWVQNSVPDSNSDLLLQIDIEGYEYETILSTAIAVLERFRVIVAEFHNLDYLFSEPLFSIYSKTFEKILQTHTCVHIHPNNVSPLINVSGFEIPQLAEFTFLRNDRITHRTFATEFPHPLDRDNVSERPSVCLPKSCYRNV